MARKKNSDLRKRRRRNGESDHSRTHQRQIGNRGKSATKGSA